MAKGRFKGWRSESTIAKMTLDEQKMYYAFVEEVKKCRELGKPLPEPPSFSTDKVVTKTEKKTKKIKKVEIPETAVDDTPKNNESNADETTRNWWDENDSKYDVQETVIHHCSREGFCYIETNEPYWINKIQKLHKKYPDMVRYQPKYCNEDMIRVKIPYKYMKRINISVHTLTDEQRERMIALGKSRKGINPRAKKDEVIENDIIDDDGDIIDSEDFNAETEGVTEELEDTLEDIFETVSPEFVPVPISLLPNVKDIITVNEEGEDYDEEHEETYNETDETKHTTKCTESAERSKGPKPSKSKPILDGSKGTNAKKMVCVPTLFEQGFSSCIKSIPPLSFSPSSRKILDFPKTTVDEW